MVFWTTIYGLLLTILGLGFYFGTDAGSFTALIPTGFGILLLLCALLGRKESLRMHVMHVAALLGLLGFFGGAPGLIKILRNGGLEGLARPNAALEQGIMAVLSLIFVVLCVRSFIAARRAREQG